jgi:hypothetical protein
MPKRGSRTLGHGPRRRPTLAAVLLVGSGSAPRGRAGGPRISNPCRLPIATSRGTSGGASSGGGRTRMGAGQPTSRRNPSSCIVTSRSSQVHRDRVSRAAHDLETIQRRSWR